MKLLNFLYKFSIRFLYCNFKKFVTLYILLAKYEYPLILSAYSILFLLLFMIVLITCIIIIVNAKKIIEKIGLYITT